MMAMLERLGFPMKQRTCERIRPKECHSFRLTLLFLTRRLLAGWKQIQDFLLLLIKYR